MKHFAFSLSMKYWWRPLHLEMKGAANPDGLSVFSVRKPLDSLCQYFCKTLLFMLLYFVCFLFLQRGNREIYKCFHYCTKRSSKHCKAKQEVMYQDPHTTGITQIVLDAVFRKISQNTCWHNCYLFGCYLFGFEMKQTGCALTAEPGSEPGNCQKIVQTSPPEDSIHYWSFPNLTGFQKNTSVPKVCVYFHFQCSLMHILGIRPQIRSDVWFLFCCFFFFVPFLSFAL